MHPDGDNTAAARAMAKRLLDAGFDPKDVEAAGGQTVRQLVGIKQGIEMETAKKIVKAVYDKLNFNQVLWMRSSGVLSQLLREEFDWLAAIQWPQQKRQAISEALLKERTLLNF